MQSFRHFPPNIDVIRWLGNYYLYAQFSEKAVTYFEKAALMEPNNPVCYVTLHRIRLLAHQPDI
jgi:intraflagellar transport protein 88